MSSAIREYVRQILAETKDDSEDEFKLRDWFSDLELDTDLRYDQFESMLFDKGLTPIRSPRKSGKYTSFLGSGKYSTAFEVLYSGKHAVAKVTESRDDISTPLALSKLRNSMPGKMANHFLEVYDVFFFKGLYVLVAEFLQPMPESLETEYWHGWEAKPQAEEDDDYYSKLRSAEFSKNKEKIGKIFQNVLEASWVSTLMPEKTINAVREALLKHSDFDKNVAIPLSSDEDIDPAPITSILKQIFKNVNKGGVMLKQMPAPEMYDEIAVDFTNAITRYGFGLRFPQSMNDTAGLAAGKESEDQRIVSLVKALEYLKKHHGVKWFDLHSLNVMARPSTGDLVVSDSGLFDVPANLIQHTPVKGEKWDQMRAGKIAGRREKGSSVSSTALDPPADAPWS